MKGCTTSMIAWFSLELQFVTIGGLGQQVQGEGSHQRAASQRPWTDEDFRFNEDYGFVPSSPSLRLARHPSSL